MSNQFWLCCSFFIKLTTWRATNLLLLKQINQSERCISSTRNKCLCCGSSWSCKVKSANQRPKLATKQCCATSWGFLYLVFRRLKRKERFPPPLFPLLPRSFRPFPSLSSVCHADYQWTMTNRQSIPIDIDWHWLLTELNIYNRYLWYGFRLIFGLTTF